MTTAAILILVGRIVLGLFFVIASFRNFSHFSERTQMVTNYGWKLPPALTALGFAMQLVGGLSVVLGIYAAWGAALLILFLIGATALFHNFALYKGDERGTHLYFTLVNCTLAGFCLMIIGLSL